MTTTTPAAPARRRFILHAGTHKTASTDIQSRLLRSRALLEQQNVRYRFPFDNVTHFKSLSHAITRGNWTLWHDYLGAMARYEGDLLLSAEQFAPRLTQLKTIRRLRSLAQQHSYELTIVIFIRSQLDYINSRYAYTLKRFYHTTTFEGYVEEVLAGRLPSSGTFTGPNAKRSDVFDFWNYFAALLKERERGLDVRFIPFRQTDPDPLRQLLTTLDLNPDLGWAASRSEALNQSPGPRATWLAREVGLRLARHGISHRVIENSSAIIPQEQSFRRWKDGSYWGFDRDLARVVRRHFKDNNDRFAQAVWGRRWKEVYIQDRTLLKRPQAVYEPKTASEMVAMQRIADHVLLRIERRRQPRAFHRLREAMERLGSTLPATI